MKKEEEEAMLVKVIVYLLSHNKTKFNYTYNKLKYLVMLYLEKHRRLIGGGAAFNEDMFKLLLYKLEGIEYINISEEILMNQFITTNVRIRREAYSLDELALLNMVIKEYSDRSVMVLHDLVNRK